MEQSKRVIPTPICLPPDLIEALDAVVLRRGKGNRSELIRSACRAYLQTIELGITA